MFLLALALAAPAIARDLAAAEDDPIEVNLQVLMNVDYERGKPLPDEILALKGKRVKITGLMALGTPEGAEQFELVNSGCECGRSKVHHFVQVTMPEGETTTYTPDEITVVGIFDVGEKIEDGFVTSLYRLKAESVK